MFLPEHTHIHTHTRTHARTHARNPLNPLHRRPLLPGDSEIDQLYRTFRAFSTPTDACWPGVTQLPDYQPTFPRWPAQPLAALVPTLNASAGHLFQVCVCVCVCVFIAFFGVHLGGSPQRRGTLCGAGVCLSPPLSLFLNAMLLYLSLSLALSLDRSLYQGRIVCETNANLPPVSTLLSHMRTPPRGALAFFRTYPPDLLAARVCPILISQCNASLKGAAAQNHRIQGTTPKWLSRTATRPRAASAARATLQLVDNAPVCAG
jgi:hypothetical protein